MGISNIRRYFNDGVNIVTIQTTDTLAAAQASGYITAQAANIIAANEGPFTWFTNDTILLSASDGNLWATINAAFTTLIAMNLATEGLAKLGIHSALASIAGGSATSSITDSAIAAGDVVIARFVSSANLVNVLTVLPGAGTLTVISTADPGVSVIEYIAYRPSVSLLDEGIVVGKGTYAGGAASFSIVDPNVTAGMVINANFQSQANTSSIRTVIAAAGSFTVVTSADPGASVVEYSAFVPTADLTALGLLGASYVNAGGSATITITDANITASSIVTADFKSQANAAVVRKVTPSAGTLTVLASADPGASVVGYQATIAGASGGTFLTSANNLSDVASASASLANLGGLPLAGGQMTGSILLDRGTATSTAGAATVNHQAGVITTEALTTASGSTYSFTLTNSRILSTSVVLLQLMGGTNTRIGLNFSVVPSAGSAAISIKNNDIAAAALNGTLIFGFVVI
jgi:hypothetical protein